MAISPIGVGAHDGSRVGGGDRDGLRVALRAQNGARRCKAVSSPTWPLMGPLSCIQQIDGYSGAAGVLGPLSLNPSSTLLSTLTAKRQIARTRSDHHPQHPHPTGPLKFVHLLAANPGVEVRVASSKVRIGSIPACAGEPSLSRMPRSPATVYPRVCGGTAYYLRDVATGNGLSPRVRGNHEAIRCRKRCSRSIPACAGEPSATPLAARPCGVYPRVCGGTDYGHHSRLPTRGLSPRVRGNRSWFTCTLRAMGSIPACAGEPAGPQSL